jgi:predicted short-subunit dehydrogenase-like oxidoreductase (DUF2520 family)
MQQKTFAIIGAGRLAHSLASALKDAGMHVNCVYSRSKRKAAAFAQKFDIPRAVSNLAELPVDTTYYLVSVSDTALPALARQLGIIAKRPAKKTFIHFSGALDSSVFKALASTRSHIASLHILQSFPTTSIVPLAGSAAACESESAACRKAVILLAKSLRLRPFTIHAGQKIIYHLMGVVLSNFLTGNLAAAESLFTAAQLKGISFNDLAAPIISATLKNAQARGIHQSLSGPLERNDIDVLKRHLAALKKTPELRHLLDYYRAQSRHLILVAKQKNKTRDYAAAEKLFKK